MTLSYGRKHDIATRAVPGLIFLLLILPQMGWADYSPFEELPDDDFCQDFMETFDPKYNKSSTDPGINSFLSPDNKLRVCQVEWSDDENIRRLTTFFQFIYQGDTVDALYSDRRVGPVKVNHDGVDEIDLIEVLSDDPPAYLFINDNVSNASFFDVHFIGYAAALQEDTIRLIPFKQVPSFSVGINDYRITLYSRRDRHPLGHDDTFYDPEWTTTIDTVEGELFYYAPDPYMKWDASSKKLKLHYGYCMIWDQPPGGCGSNFPFYHMYLSKYEFQDSAFIKTSSSSWKKPSLEEARDTVHRESIQVAKQNMDIGRVLFYRYHRNQLPDQHMKTFYQIGDHFEYKTYPKQIWDDTEIEDGCINYPETKAINEDATLMKLTEFILPDNTGICGGCPIETFSFYLLKDNNSELLLEFNLSPERNWREYNIKGVNGESTRGNFTVQEEKEDDYSRGFMNYYLKTVEIDWIDNNKIKAQVIDKFNPDDVKERTYVFTIKSEGDTYYVEKEIEK